MSQTHSDDAKAILLMCAVFGSERTHKPLTLTEYNTLVRALVAHSMRPADLLAVSSGDESMLRVSTQAGLEPQRLSHLLERGVQLGFALEEWERSGIWLVTRADDEYPRRFKTHLGHQAPPLLYGVGSRVNLSQGGGLAIVGSRHVGEEEDAFTRRVASQCAAEGIPVVSGGAKGVDIAAMEAAMEAGGAVVGVLAENLLRKSVQAKARKGIGSGNLTLVSMVHPKARFTVWNAMGRNKLMYALGDYALVVQSDKGKGGTWGGATEELKRDRHRPVFVRETGRADDGNSALLEMGATPWVEPQGDERLTDVLAKQVAVNFEKCVS